MKTIGSVVLALAMAAGCVQGPSTDQSALELTGSGGGSGVGSQAGNASVWHGTWNGQAVSAYTYDGTSGLWLNAAENGHGPTRTANMNFTFSGPDPSSQVCYTYGDPWWGTYTYCYYTQFINEYGWGTINASDLQFGPDGRSAHLHTTTDPNVFTIQRCTWSYWSWYSDCTTGTSETFDLSWNKNGQSFSASNGVNWFGYGGYSTQTQGQYSSVSADVTGTALGSSLSTSSGSISDSKGTSVSRDVIATPKP